MRSAVPYSSYIFRGLSSHVKYGDSKLLYLPMLQACLKCCHLYNVNLRQVDLTMLEIQPFCR